VAGEVALEQAGGVAAALAFGDASGDVLASRRVVLAAVEDDRVEGAVELAVAAAAEAVAAGEAAGGGQWCDAGEPSEAGFGVDPVAVGPGDDQLCGHDRADTGLVEQLGDERADVAEDLALERLGLGGGGLDPACERAQDEDRGELGGRPRVGAAEVAATVEQLAE
jgi:hypothetical protein